ARISCHTPCSICTVQIYSYNDASNIPCNWTVNSLLPLVKNTFQQNPANENNADSSIKKLIEIEMRNKIEKDIKGRVSKAVKENIDKQKVNLSRNLKVKIENEYKKKMRNLCRHELTNTKLKASAAMMKKEIENLKNVRKLDISEVRRLQEENKKQKAEVTNRIKETTTT
ncbi:unnamed protein product, partial [Meganyctiphanes norvegica]